MLMIVIVMMIVVVIVMMIVMVMIVMVMLYLTCFLPIIHHLCRAEEANKVGRDRVTALNNQLDCMVNDWDQEWFVGRCPL